MSKKIAPKKPIPLKKSAVSANLGSTHEVFFKYGYWAAFIVCLIISLKYCFVGINNYILDIHGFRQTQTAISAFYTLKNGFSLDYLTPVLGAPWKIPFEFPLYQWIVVVLKKISPFTLDLCGRLVSLAFFYATLFPAHKILVKYTNNKALALVPLTFILLHPIYIFWSRTFMIESTALFFSVAYLWQAMEYLQSKKVLNFVLASVCILLATLVKVTTAIPFILFLAVLILSEWIKEKGYTFNIKTTLKYLAYCVFLFIIPVIITKLWVDHSDKLKALNTYANEVTSSTKLGAWNYGTLEQKISPDVWIAILKNSSLYNPAFYFFLAILYAAIVLLKLKYRKHALCSLLLYFAAPAIFTNLHKVHNYYTYSNSVFFCISLGFIAMSLLSARKPLLIVAGAAFCIFTLSYMFNGYMNDYYKTQKTNTDFAVTIGNMVKQMTAEDEVILVYGNDWGSEYAYYSERKTIALKNIFKSVNDTVFKYIMKQNENYKIRTMVFVTMYNMFDNKFINEFLTTYKYKEVFKQEPFYIFQKPDA